MPVRAQRDDGVIQIDTDSAAHAYNQRLAVDHRQTLIPMGYYVVQGGLIGTALIAGGLNGWWLAAVASAVLVLAVMAFNRGRPAAGAALARS